MMILRLRNDGHAEVPAADLDAKPLAEQRQGDQQGQQRRRLPFRRPRKRSRGRQRARDECELGRPIETFCELR